MSTEPIKDSDGNTPAHYWAKGGMWFLILLGIGGCSALGGSCHIKLSDPTKEERP